MQSPVKNKMIRLKQTKTINTSKKTNQKDETNTTKETLTKSCL